jgi:tetratricopeptide (TPR) repeat protein
LTAAFLLALAFGGSAFAAATPKPPPLLSAPPAPDLPGPPRSQEADAQTYQRCMELAARNPAAAQALAESWRAKGGAHPAEHCLAVALIGLKRYNEAARHLETLAQAMVRAPAGLRAGVLDQAAQAWLLAGNPAHSYTAATGALDLKPNDPDLLVDRAEAAGAAGWFAKAVADLDRVLKADPSRAEALIYRASAYRAEGRLDAALADIGQALKLAPQSVAALLERGNIRRLKGDIEGAQADWIRVAARAPGSAAAADAEANLARLRSEEKGAAVAKPSGRK